MRTEARRCRAPPRPEASGLSVPSLSEGPNDTTIVRGAQPLKIIEICQQSSTILKIYRLELYFKLVALTTWIFINGRETPALSDQRFKQYGLEASTP